MKVEYDLEYGTDSLEMHHDALTIKNRVLVVDDILATGGTAGAAERLVQESGASLVGSLFFAELEALNGRSRLGDSVHSILQI